jgi:hypothetical protein
MDRQPGIHNSVSGVESTIQHIGRGEVERRKGNKGEDRKESKFIEARADHGMCDCVQCGPQCRSVRLEANRLLAQHN